MMRSGSSVIPNSSGDEEEEEDDIENQPSTSQAYHGHGHGHLEDTILEVTGGYESDRPLLSSSIHRKTAFTMSRIKKSIAVDHIPMRIPEMQNVDFGTDALKWDSPEGRDKDIYALMVEVRNLPDSMAKKRHYMEELRRAAQISSAHEFFFTHHFITYWHMTKAKFREFVMQMRSRSDLWSSSFKEIEGVFGTAVVSYFIFLRWIVIINIMMFSVIFVFIILPHFIKNFEETYFNTTDTDNFDKYKPVNSTLVQGSNYRKAPPNKSPIDDLTSLLNLYTFDGFTEATLTEDSAQDNSNLSALDKFRLSKYCTNRYHEFLVEEGNDTFLGNVRDFFQGAGWMMDTVLMSGFYMPTVELFSSMFSYHMGVALITVFLVLIIINLLLMLTYATMGLDEAVVEKLEDCSFFSPFVEWDFCIMNEQAAKDQNLSIHKDFVHLLFESRKLPGRGWSKWHKARVYFIRSLFTVASLIFLIFSYYIIFTVVNIQLKSQGDDVDMSETLYFVIQFLPPFCMTAMNFLLPFSLSFLVRYEEYDKDDEVNVILIRIVLMRLASIVILSISFYREVMCEPRDICGQGVTNSSCSSQLCWETSMGQQMYRLIMMDFFAHAGIIFLVNIPWKYLHNKYENTWIMYWLGSPYFDIPVEVICLVYSQTLVWLGMFYSPFLPFIGFVKCILIFYIKRFDVLHNCSPGAQTVQKASRTNAIFILMLILSYLIVICIMSFSVTHIEPSVACSPFRLSKYIMEPVANAIKRTVPEIAYVISFIFSPIFFIPVFFLMAFIIYVYFVFSWMQKKRVKTMKVQLALEARDRHFLLIRLNRVRHRLAGDEDTEENYDDYYPDDELDNIEESDNNQDKKRNQ